MMQENFMVVYISGAISGISDRNRFAFSSAALQVREQFGKNCDVINPVLIGEKVDELFAATNEEIGADEKPNWSDYMRHCIRELTRATHILMLPDWKKSKGANEEKRIAESLGIKVCYNIEDLRQSQQNAMRTGKW